MIAAVLALVPLQTPAGPARTVEIVRDRFGVQHVFADSEAAAFFGLGYAHARDRAFQMYWSLRIMQGRLSELVGRLPARNRRRGDSVRLDRRMRTEGWWRHARRLAAALDPHTKRLLAAFAAGVNRYLRAPKRGHRELFARFGLEPEPWTPAASLAVFWRMARFFGPDGTRDLMAARMERSGRVPGRGPVDDEAAVVRLEDVPRAWVEELRAFARAHGLAPEGPRRGGGRRFSHAWVVSGELTTTGAAVLVSDPQTPVTNPSLFYEFHVSGGGIDARGIGVAGSPILLIGFDRDVAWGMTALGGDQADLFTLRTDPKRPGGYVVDGRFRPFEQRREQIRVRGARPLPLEVRETLFGPVVTDFVFHRPGDPEVALKRVPLADRDRETVQGALAMMRARSAREFLAACAGWRFPTANVVFGDRAGHIGYTVVGAFPLRAPGTAPDGRRALDGSSSAHDWRGFLPARLLPQVLDPKRGWILSANHRPVQSWYPLPLGNTTGAAGDGLRSWRLRELLRGRRRFRPEDVLAIHYDDVNPAKRELVRLAFHASDDLGLDLSPPALQALGILEPWFRRGCHASLSEPGAGLALHLACPFRAPQTPLAEIFGGGQAGLTLWLKDVKDRLDEDPEAGIGPLELAYADAVLARAFDEVRRLYGPERRRIDAGERARLRRRRLGWFESLDGFPSLDRRLDLPFPGLAVVDGNTIRSQAAQSYTQWVPLDDPDRARTILPIGASELPDSPFRTSTYELWAQGRLHPAPLSRRAVLALAVERFLLEAPR